MAHDHHAHGRSSGSRHRYRLAATLVLVVAYMVAEFVGGLLTNSLALLADAGHMLSDAAALGLALFAIRVAQRPPSARRTYGFYRTEILAALVNGAMLVVIAVLIVVEAVRRLAAPPDVRGGVMMAIAAGGLLVNLAALAILHGGRDASLNLRGAWLHVLTDTLGSVQALAAGALILAFGWRWADPVASLAIGLLVVISAWSLLRETVGVLMEGVPPHIELAEVVAALRAVDGVEDVHDLHIWTITSGFVALSAHVVVRHDCPEDVLWRLRETIRERFDIEHATLQVEHAAAPVQIASRAER